MRIWLLLIGLVIAGCRASAPILVPIVPVEFTEIESALDSVWSHSIPTSLKAKAVLVMKNPLYSGTLNAEIELRRADSLRIIFRVRGLGIEGGRILITPDSIFFYNRFTQTLHVASSSYPALPGFLNVGHAMEQMLGLVRPSRQTPLSLRSMTDELALEDSLSRITYTVDPEYWRVIHVAHKDTLGRLLESLYFNDFIPVNQAYFPREVIYRNPILDTSAILNYRMISTGEPIASMSLDLPRDVIRLEIPSE